MLIQVANRQSAHVVPVPRTSGYKGAAGRFHGHGTSQKVTAGKTLFAEGEDADTVFEVVQGILKLYKLLPDGRRQITGFVTTDQLIGFSDEDVYEYTAEAVTDVTLSRYSRAQFERSLDEVPGFARRVLTARSHDLQSAQEQMVLLGRKTAAERIATFLLNLRDLQPTRGSAMLQVPMTRADIADYLGLTIETVSRTLTKLKRERIISLPEAVKIQVINANRLQELAAGEALEAA
jgi:CRP/FNR family transcriptional regulator